MEHGSKVWFITDYFVKHIKNAPTITENDLKLLLEIKIMNALNPLVVSKRLGFEDCKLCTDKCIEITEKIFKLGIRHIVNKNDVICSTWRHKARFQWLEQAKSLRGDDKGTSQKINHKW